MIQHQCTQYLAAIAVLGALIPSASSVAAPHVAVSWAFPPHVQAASTHAAVDRDPETYWSTPGRPAMQAEHITLDLGSTADLGRVRMLSRSDNANYFPRAFQIQVSSDNVNFTVVHVETDFRADPGTWYSFDITPAVSGRHVRILVTQANQSPEGLFFVQIAEIEIDPAGATALPTSNNALTVSLLDDIIHTSTLTDAVSSSGVGAQTRLLLSWAAPGDDLNVGTAAAYEIRFSTSNIGDGNFTDASLIPGVPLPEPAGTPQRHTLDLSPGCFFFAMIAIDEAGNRSPLSNVVQFTIPCASDCSACLTNKLTWDPSSGSATEYRIYISQTSGVYDFGNPIESIAASGPLEWPLADGNLGVGVRYYAVVTAVDEDGSETGPSNEIDIIINGLP